MRKRRLSLDPLAHEVKLAVVVIGIILTLLIAITY
jgi:hypothetical protein